MNRRSHDPERGTPFVALSGTWERRCRRCDGAVTVATGAWLTAVEVSAKARDGFCERCWRFVCAQRREADRRRPLPPHMLVGALQDRVHLKMLGARPARAVRYRP